ncbi:MAG: 1-(5-phosphoribosyl)-5-[(5-phosphoribosylamino)methylideneamino]imidazole-4-carboxamide isomerase [Solirubrobacteraceae bacterium]|jgi:phosphoribosylformimino-5-aminoimidazole carboxamide ribotide isomerase
MILLPAVDILGGKAVRLAQGDFERQDTYDADPLQAAQRWVQEGARALHIVDLDGARTGAPANFEHVARIIDGVDVPVQVGGGLRSAGSVADAIAVGAARVVLGTAALHDVDLLDACIAAHGDRIVVSIDARRGRVATSGWTEQTEIPAESAIERLTARGVHRFVYSSIERDGMLAGPDVGEVTRIATVVRGTFIYSGGISSLPDLQALAALRQVNLAGVIVGTALYRGRFTVAEGQAAVEG